MICKKNINGYICVKMVFKQHCALYPLLLNIKKKNLLNLLCFEKMQEIAHLRDMIEARGMTEFEKLLDLCNKHI